MLSKLRVLGLAIGAVLAVSAVSAVSAQAALFHSEVATTYYSGSSVIENVFTTAAGKVKCKKATFAGESTATGGSGTNNTITTVKVTPTYSECTAFGQAATIHTGGTHFYFEDGMLSKVENTTNSIQITVPTGNCSVTVPSQTPGTNTVDFTNEGSGSSRDILVTSTVAKVKYIVDGPGTICGTPGTYEGAAGATYTGTVTVKGFKNAALTEPVGVWYE